MLYLFWVFGRGGAREGQAGERGGGEGMSQAVELLTAHVALFCRRGLRRLCTLSGGWGGPGVERVLLFVCGSLTLGGGGGGYLTKHCSNFLSTVIHTMKGCYGGLDAATRLSPLPDAQMVVSIGCNLHDATAATWIII